MLCPRCKDVLRLRLVGTVEIDQCLQCNGMWFERDELRQAKDEADGLLDWLDFDIWQREDRFRVSPTALICPRCQGPMVAVEYGETGVEVDCCPRCQGVWLDGGEFEEIVEALRLELGGKDVAGYVRASLEEAREVLGGPEGMAGEWRDFTTVIRLLQYRILEENPALRALLEAVQRSSATL